MRIFYILIILICFLPQTVNAQAPDWIWAKSVGGISFDYSRTMVIDPDNNLYIVGGFYSTTDFDPGTGVFDLTPVGFYDIFVLKLDSTGNFLWVKQFGGLNNDYCNAITIDENGNIYIAGYFRDTCDFDPDAGVFNLTSVGWEDIFICKLTSSGNFIWAKQMGGSYTDNARAIAMDTSGNDCIYITGTYRDTADFDPGAGIFNLTAPGGEAIYITKLDSSGNFVWAKQLGGAHSDLPEKIIVDPTGSGCIYTTGYFRWTGDFDPGVGIYNLSSVGWDDIFISKLDSSGNFIWAKSMGSSSSWMERGF